MFRMRVACASIPELIDRIDKAETPANEHIVRVAQSQSISRTCTTIVGERRVPTTRPLNYEDME